MWPADGAACCRSKTSGTVDAPRLARLTIAPETPATIIYTSGTTGTPRGVVHTHRTLLAEAALAANPFRLSDADRVACPTSLAWLASLFTLLGPLVVGSCACPFDVAAHGIERFAAWARAARLTHISMRVVVRQLLQRSDRTVFPDPRIVMIGGDTIYRQDIEAACDLFPNAIIGTGLASSEAGRVSYLFMDRATPLPRRGAARIRGGRQARPDPSTRMGRTPIPPRPARSPCRAATSPRATGVSRT